MKQQVIPPEAIQAPIVHEISILYGQLYLLGNSLKKRDRYGIQRTIEEECLGALRLSISAALERKDRKYESVRRLSVHVETLKHLVRCAHEVECIPLQSYIELQKKLQVISKSASNWLKYLERNEAPL